MTHYPIGQLKVKPQERSRISLGSYSKTSSPKGFSVMISPRTAAAEIESEMVELDNHDKRNIVLYVVNHGLKTITARVWSI